jgi:hypothetical protein
MIKITESGATVVTGQHIGLYALLALKQRLRLEGFGMKARGASALKIARDSYGLKGNRAKVLKELERMIENWQPAPEVE